MNEYLIALIVMSAVITLLIIDNIVIRVKRRRVASQLLQQTLDKVALLNEIGKLTEQNQAKEIEQTDGFLKFVSDSRDWAFGYIEEVQAALGAFDKKMSVLLGYAKTYGSVVDSHLAPTVKQIDEAYQELLKILPKENNN
jgi:hypothetical protein